MLLRLDPTSPASLFDQLADELRTEILTGGLTAGERLPPATELALSLDLNRNTVLRSYQLLRDEGLVELRQGRGAIVAKRDHDLTDLLTQARDLATHARSLNVSAEALCALIRKEY